MDLRTKMHKSIKKRGKHSKKRSKQNTTIKKRSKYSKKRKINNNK